MGHDDSSGRLLFKQVVMGWMIVPHPQQASVVSRKLPSIRCAMLRLGKKVRREYSRSGLPIYALIPTHDLFSPKRDSNSEKHLKKLRSFLLYSGPLLATDLVGN
jgi:hypothetical protein